MVDCLPLTRTTLAMCRASSIVDFRKRAHSEKISDMPVRSIRTIHTFLHLFELFPADQLNTAVPDQVARGRISKDAIVLVASRRAARNAL